MAVVVAGTAVAGWPVQRAYFADQMSVDGSAPELAWTASDPGAVQLMPPPAALFRLDRPPDPGRCSD